MDSKGYQGQVQSLSFGTNVVFNKPRINVLTNDFSFFFLLLFYFSDRLVRQAQNAINIKLSHIKTRIFFFFFFFINFGDIKINLREIKTG